MDASALEPWVLPAAVVAYAGFRFLRFRAVRSRLPELLRRGAVIVDVRGPSEYAAGASARSVNIPLSDLDRRAGELDASKPVIVCCASGTRSAMAAGVLKRRGFKEVVNAGSWRNTLLEDNQ